MRKQGKLYLLAGASGAGKSLLASEMGKSDNMVVYQKKTTRPDRPNDFFADTAHDGNLRDLRANRSQLVYHYNREAYGLCLPEITKMLQAGKNVIAVVNNYLAIALLRKTFSGRISTIFVHRDIGYEDLRQIIHNRQQTGLGVENAADESRLEKELLTRWLARETLYDQYNSGRFCPDYVVINDVVPDAIGQIKRIIFGQTVSSLACRKAPILHLILAGTGADKDRLLRMAETVPGGERFIVPKYSTRLPRPDDGKEIICQTRLPDNAIVYSYFGVEYGIDPKKVQRQIAKTGLGFLTVSHIPTAQAIQNQLRQSGMNARLWYLHQAPSDMASYPKKERRRRRQHSQELLELYKNDLVCRKDCGVILPVNGETSLSSWAQTRMLEANVPIFDL